MLKPKFKAQASGLSPVGRCLIEHTPNVLLYGRRASNPVTSSNTTSSITYQLAHKRNSYTYVCSSTIFHSSFLSPVLVFILICEMALGFRVSRQEEVEEKKLSFAESSCWSSSFIAPWREIKRSVFWLLSALLCWQNVKRCRDFKRMQQFENCALASSFFITIPTRVRPPPSSNPSSISAPLRRTRHYNSN